MPALAEPPPQSRLPLSGFSLFHTRDVDQARESVARIFCPHALNTCHARDRLDARHHSAPLGSDVSLNYVQYGPAVDIDPGCLGSFYLLQIPLRGGADVRCGGREVRADSGHASLPSPTEPLRMRWAADSPHLIVRFSQAALLAQLEQLAQAPVQGPPIFDPGVPLGLAQVAPAIAFVHYLCGALDADAAFSGSPLARQAERYLISTLLMQLPHSHQRLLDASAQRPLLPRAVRRAQEFMRAHAGEPLSLVDLCQHLGVSARSLQQAFVVDTGESPMAHWRNLRLDLVRQALQGRGKAGGESVSLVAQRFGFFHAGHFAAHYQRRFGERPGDTACTHNEPSRRG